MLRAMEDKLFKKAVKLIFKNCSQLQINLTSDFAKLYTISKRKKIF